MMYNQDNIEPVVAAWNRRTPAAVPVDAKAESSMLRATEGRCQCRCVDCGALFYDANKCSVVCNECAKPGPLGAAADRPGANL
jgi:hypothetical protein